MSGLRAIIVPGNGDGDVRRSNWYAWLQKRLMTHPAFDEVLLKNMPDPIRARRSICALEFESPLTNT